MVNLGQYVKIVVVVLRVSFLEGRAGGDLCCGVEEMQSTLSLSLQSKTLVSA